MEGAFLLYESRGRRREFQVSSVIIMSSRIKVSSGVWCLTDDLSGRFSWLRNEVEDLNSGEDGRILILRDSRTSENFFRIPLSYLKSRRSTVSSPSIHCQSLIVNDAIRQSIKCSSIEWSRRQVTWHDTQCPFLDTFVNRLLTYRSSESFYGNKIRN